jgi:CBS domain-containing protein
MHTKDIMTSKLVTIAPGSSLREAAQQMQKHNIGALPVFDGKKLHGIVTDRDLTVRAMANGNDCEKTHVDEIMTKNCVTCTESEDLEKAINLMEKHSVRRIVVTRAVGNHEPIGIFSLDDVARKSSDEKLSSNAFIRLNKESRKKAH